jgi:acyl-CoA hydrolase
LTYNDSEDKVNPLNLPLTIIASLERLMKITTYSTYHLVKSEELNHHGTLYAGRTAEWFVEAGFIAAASMTQPENIVCLKIHGMTFSRPVKLGELICFNSKIIYAGHTSMIAYIDTKVKEDSVVKGFITFIHADLDGKPLPHGIVLDYETDEDKELMRQAKALPR